MIALLHRRLCVHNFERSSCCTRGQKVNKIDEAMNKISAPTVAAAVSLVDAPG